MSLGISPRKITSIIFLLATIILSLLLSRIPMLVSNNLATIPVQEGMSHKKMVKPFEHPLPRHIVVQEGMSTNPKLAKPFELPLPSPVIVQERAKPIVKTVPKYVNKQSTKVFDQVFGLMDPNSNFKLVHNF